MSIAGQFKNAIRSGVGKNQTTNSDGITTLINDGFTTIYTTPSTFASYVIECDIACVGDSGVQVSVRVKKSDGTKAHVVKSAPVPVGSSIQIIDGQKLVLEAGDSLEVTCETAGESVDVIVSLVENVNN
jgi:hypothetical protein